MGKLWLRHYRNIEIDNTIGGGSDIVIIVMVMTIVGVIDNDLGKQWAQQLGKPLGSGNRALGNADKRGSQQCPL